MDRFRLVGRGLAVGAVTLLTVASAPSCGFPDHAFVDDSEFYGNDKKKDAGTSGGGTTGDASLPGSGGETMGSGGTTASSGGAEGGLIGTDARPSKVDGSADGATTGPADASPDAPEAGLTCDPGKTACGGACVDFLADPLHCGACTTACKGADVCQAGVCGAPCAAGLTNCAGVCVDVLTNADHCGGCNKTPCASGNICENGTCVIDCGTLTRCGPGLCVDTTTDDVHCGDCSTNCRTKNQVCSGGKCQANCSFPYIACASTCVNPNTDAQNCNGCGKGCSTGEACVNAVCTKLVENCQNGSDDDGDTLVDCADPDCTAKYTCASTPAGWNGPVALWTGTPNTEPSCSSSGGYTTATLSADAGLIVPPYTCPSCTCAPSAGMTCDALTFQFDTSTDCSQKAPYADQTLTPGTACQKFSLCCGASAQSALLAQPMSNYVHGACTATQAAPSFPAPSWTTEVVGCAAPPSIGGGCGGAQCMPKPAAPFGAKLCVYRAGIATCPTDYPNQQPSATEDYYQAVKDTRSCSACSCTSSCGGSITTYTDDACSVSPTPLSFSGATTCTTIPADPTRTLSFSGNSDTRSYKFLNAGPVCGTVPGSLSGTATPDQPVTVCCQK